jgi:hypothetical protein
MSVKPWFRQLRQTTIGGMRHARWQWVKTKLTTTARCCNLTARLAGAIIQALATSRIVSRLAAPSRADLSLIKSRTTEDFQ